MGPWAMSAPGHWSSPEGAPQPSHEACSLPLVESPPPKLEQRGQTRTVDIGHRVAELSRPLYSRNASPVRLQGSRGQAHPVPRLAPTVQRPLASPSGSDRPSSPSWPASSRSPTSRGRRWSMGGSRVGHAPSHRIGRRNAARPGILTLSEKPVGPLVWWRMP